MTHSQKYLACILITLIAIVGTMLLSPVPQDPAYHNFADQRTILGIQNFWDVISNLPFVIVGLFGITFLKEVSGFKMVLLTTMIVGLVATGFGSAWYHYWRSTESLGWDRLPMTVVFMTFFTLIIYEKVNKGFAKAIYVPLLLTGIFSVIYWKYSESIGQGDLRMYAFVQFFPMIMMPVILTLFKGWKQFGKLLFMILGFYGFAKICEHFDREIFESITVMSGHTLKHFLASVATWYILLTFRK